MHLSEYIIGHITRQDIDQYMGEKIVRYHQIYYVTCKEYS